MEKQVIGVWGISNVASLNVWEMNSDAMLVGINDDTPEWCEIEFQPDEEESDDDGPLMNAGINFHGSFWRLDNCMRVR